MAEPEVSKIRNRRRKRRKVVIVMLEDFSVLKFLTPNTKLKSATAVGRGEWELTANEACKPLRWWCHVSDLRFTSRVTPKKTRLINLHVAPFWNQLKFIATFGCTRFMGVRSACWRCQRARLGMTSRESHFLNMQHQHVGRVSLTSPLHAATCWNIPRFLFARTAIHFGDWISFQGERVLLLWFMKSN